MKYNLKNLTLTFSRTPSMLKWTPSSSKFSTTPVLLVEVVDVVVVVVVVVSGVVDVWGAGVVEACVHQIYLFIN